MEKNSVDYFVDGLEMALGDQCGKQIDHFLASYDTNQWIITSDFSIGRPDFACDGMAFALMPYRAETFPPDVISQRLPVDFKKAGKVIDSHYIEYLRNGPFFHFGFLVDRDQHHIPTPELGKDALERTLAMMRAWPNAHEPQNSELIRKTELCLSKYKTTSFLKKVNQMWLLAVLGTTIALVTTRRKMLDLIVWAPDRDVITAEWEGLANAWFHANLHSAFHRRKFPENYRHAQLTDDPHARKLWFDAYVRVADYLATPVASFSRKVDGMTIEEQEQKYGKCFQVIREVMADNPKVVVQSLGFVQEHPELIKPELRLIKMSQTPLEKPVAVQS